MKWVRRLPLLAFTMLVLLDVSTGQTATTEAVAPQQQGPTLHIRHYHDYPASQPSTSPSR
jgi:hypothetical protein